MIRKDLDATAWANNTDNQPQEDGDWGFPYDYAFVKRFYWRRRNGAQSYTESLAQDDDEYPGLHQAADLYGHLYACREWFVKQTIKDMQGNS